jgi:hypothetical protein
MRKSFVAAVSAFGFFAVLFAVSAPFAEAAIVCNDEFQKVKGQEIATPYCGDAYLAKIAREHGVKVSADEVRENVAKKYELCRFLAGDNRADDVCPTSDGGSGHQR